MPRLSGEDPGDDSSGSYGRVGLMLVCGFVAAAIILAIAERLRASATIIAISFVALTLCTYVVLGILGRSAHAGQYLVAGRRVPAAFTGMALAAECLSVGGFLGLAGTLYVLGFDGTAAMLGLMAGLVVMGVLIVPYLRKLGAYTVSDFFAARYGGLPRLLSVMVVLAISFVLMVAQLYAIGVVASRFVGVPYAWAVWGATALLLICVLPGGMKAASWTQVAQYLVVLLALLTPVLLVALQAFDLSLPVLGYGEALTKVTALETTLVENQLADPGTLKPHASPFLQLSPTTFIVLTLTLAAGVASLPHLIMTPLSTPSVRQSRMSVAWASFFLLLVAVSAPAYAVYTKLNLFGVIEKGARFDALPSWMEDASRKDVLRIHGVSLHLLDVTAAAVATGARVPDAVATQLKAIAPEGAARFAKLSESVQSSLIEAASASTNDGGGARWIAFQKSVLPAAATAEGNETGALVESAVWIDPRAIVLLLPEMFALPKAVTALVLAGAFAVALASATGLLIAISHALGHDLYAGLIDRHAPPARQLIVNRLATLLGALASSWVALRPPDELVTLALWTFSLAAAGLLPALVLGIWWKRANAWGAAAGMIGGLGLCLYYMAGTQFFPMAFHDLWGSLIPTSDIALDDLARLRGEWLEAEDDAKVGLAALIAGAARGGVLQAGAASWLSVPSMCAGVFAVPVGALLTVLVSLLTPRPSGQTLALIDEMRVPRGPEMLKQEHPEGVSPRP